MVLRNATIAVVDVGAWRSLVAYLNGVQRAGGSNPLAPTNNNLNRRKGGFLIFFVSSLYPLVDIKVSDEYKDDGKCEGGGIGRRTGLRIQPACAGRGSNPLSRTRLDPVLT